MSFGASRQRGRAAPNAGHAAASAAAASRQNELRRRNDVAGRAVRCATGLAIACVAVTAITISMPTGPMTTASLAETKTPVDRFGFAACPNEEAGGCFPPPPIAADALARLEACARDKPCQYRECEPKFAAGASFDSGSPQADKLDDLRRRADQRCRMASIAPQSARPAPSAPPRPVMAIQPAARRHVVAAGTYYANLEWLEPSSENKAGSGENARCQSGRISLTVTRDNKVAWSIGEQDRAVAWTAQVDPDTGNIRTAPGSIEIATAGRVAVPLPGEVEIAGHFAQFTIRFPPCGRGRVTVRNLARTDSTAAGKRQ